MSCYCSFLEDKMEVDSGVWDLGSTRRRPHPFLAARFELFSLNRRGSVIPATVHHHPRRGGDCSPQLRQGDATQPLM